MANGTDNLTSKFKVKKEQKVRRIHLVVTEKEYEELLKLSKEHKNLSDYIRNSSLEKSKNGFAKTKELSKLLNDLTKEMKALGQNLNQAVRYSNFLLEHNIAADIVGRFNTSLVKYTALQMNFEKQLKKIFQ